MPTAVLPQVVHGVALRVASPPHLESLTAVFGAALQARLRNPRLSHLAQAFPLNRVSLTLAFAVVLSPWTLLVLVSLSE